MYFLSWPPYMSVYGFWKILNFHQFGEKLTKTLYFLAVTPIFPISYTLRYRIWVFMGFTRSKYVGVTLDFTEITTLGAKTYWNSVFFGRDPHILDWLYIAGPYMSFFKFWKIDFFFKIHICYPTVLLKITCLGAKTDRNSIFLGRDRHMMDRLYITVPYISFYGFWKNSNFRSKSIGVSLRF
jgi:hypothetical protein